MNIKGGRKRAPLRVLTAAAFSDSENCDVSRPWSPTPFACAPATVDLAKSRFVMYAYAVGLSSRRIIFTGLGTKASFLGFG